MKGKVYLIGAGPGNPELITLKGLKCLRKAQVLIYDRLTAPELVKYVPKTAKIIYAGKSSGRHALTQNQINMLLVKFARQGKIVVRLKGGDPFLFGRGGEECEFLAAHEINFEVVPGVTSATAVPAYAGIPLTHRRFASSVGIFTGHKADTKKVSALNWKKISTGLDTLVFLMGVENLSCIVKNLIKSGRHPKTPCCLIQNGTMLHQKIVVSDIGSIVDKAKSAKIMPPSVFIVGDVVSLQNKIRPLGHLSGDSLYKPLSGKKILITSPFRTSLRFKKILENYGAQCMELPLLQIKPLRDYAKFDSVIRKINDFQYIIFTSQNAVQFFRQRFDCLNKEKNILEGIKIAAIGPQTKNSLENMGLKVDIQPDKFCQEGLIECFKKIDIKGRNILIVCSLQARSLLKKSLKKMGGHIKILFAYRSVSNNKKRELLKFLKEKIDIITFTSASCVRSFLKTFPEGKNFLRRKKILIATIGPITSSQALSLGLKVDIQAKDYTLKGLAQAIVKHYNSDIRP